MLYIDKAKFSRMLIKLRLSPICIYCIHHVCSIFDAASMYEEDWTNIDVFKSKIIGMREQGIVFISLSEAYEKIRHDYFRKEKYAVLTFDDGYSTLKEILPWLEKQQIPATLFVNGEYLDGKSFRESPCESYLTKDEIFSLTGNLIEIGSHGWRHISVYEMSDEEFESSLIQNMRLLLSHPRFVNFYAYTYGHHRRSTDSLLYKYNSIPVLVNGGKNYNDKAFINRELFV